MITLTEEPYEHPAAVALVAALLAETNVRYADEIAHLTEEELAEGDADYLNEVTPELVRRPHGTFVVAWIDGQAVGCGALRALDAADRVGEIKRMYTDPSARRSGVSRAVLARLEEVAAELGYQRLQLETGTAQPEALALYEGQGWHRIEPYGRWKDAPSSVCFAKDLADP